MSNEARVTRMRLLLSEAAHYRPDGGMTRLLRHVDGGIAIDGMQRKAMVKQLKLAASRYGLEGDIEAYVEAAGHATLAGLETAELRVLSNWVSKTMDGMLAACDSPDVPPAR